MRSFDVVFRGGTVLAAGAVGGAEICDVGVRDGRFAAFGDLRDAPAAEVVDVRGLHLLPGVIDSQVHLREPGLEHKEDLGTGTAAAALGGVTGIFEMPNTKPGTTDAAALADKLARAATKSWVDHAFYVGASAANAERLAELELLPGCAGVKMFMGSSTGDLLVPDDANIARVLANGRRRVAVHAEDEPRLIERKATIAAQGGSPALHPLWRDEETALRATTRVLRLAEAARRRVHILHVTTAEEMALLAEHREVATVECLPHHLTLVAPDCYERLGTYAQMNPPVRDRRHQDALWRAVRDGTVDVLGSDHAPHTRAEKEKPWPQSPSGMPGVQTLLPVMLDHVAQGRLSLARLVDLTSAGPCRVFGLAGKGRIARGYDADLSIVDLGAKRTITDAWIASRCRWTPYHGMPVTGWPIATVVRGRAVMRDGELLGQPQGRPIRFTEAAGVH